MTDKTTPTPRTNAEQQSYWTDYESVEKMWVCLLDFARTLERELAAAIAERDGLREQVERMREALEYTRDFIASRGGCWPDLAIQVEKALSTTPATSLRQEISTAQKEPGVGPFLYGCTICGGANYGCKCNTTEGLTIPLYDHYF